VAPTRILGLSAYYHDSAACLLVDGRIVAAAQEERFSRKKHDERFPAQAVDYCLKEAGIDRGEIDFVGFYEKPLVKFDRLLESYIATAPRGLRSYLMAMPIWLGQKLWLADEIKRELAIEKDVLFGDHHESHAASAFYPSPFEEAAVLTIDGVGEWTTSSVAHGNGAALSMIREMRFPHSVGLLYSAFTYFTGFKVNEGEYKIMGLAPYGQPTYLKAIRDNIVDIHEDGSIELNLEYFEFVHGLTMTGGGFERLFGGPRRDPDAPVTQREMDLARSVQEITEEVMLRMAKTAHRETGSRKLCLAGGVALNCVGNGRLLREGPFSDIWIQPAAGDAGGALGVAYALWHRYLGKPRVSAEAAGTWQPQGSGSRSGALPGYADAMQGSLLGPAYSDADIGAWLTANSVGYWGVGDDRFPHDTAWTLRSIYETPLPVLLATNAAITSADLREEIAAIDVPVLVVQGDADLSAPIEITGQPTAALAAKGRLEVIAGAGHGLYTSYAAAWNAAVLAAIG